MWFEAAVVKEPGVIDFQNKFGRKFTVGIFDKVDLSFRERNEGTDDTKCG